MTEKSTREAALDVADRQMKAGGYDALNFADIAREIETTRPNLHHHFKSKESLANETVDRYRASSMQMMNDIIAENPDDFVAYLTAIEDGFVNWLPTSDRTASCICSQIITEAGAPEVLTQKSLEFFQEKQDTILALIERSIAAGKLRPDIDPKRLTVMTATILMGFQQMAMASTDRAALSKHLKGFLVNWVSPYLPEGQTP